MQFNSILFNLFEKVNLNDLVDYFLLKINN